MITINRGFQQNRWESVFRVLRWFIRNHSLLSIINFLCWSSRFPDCGCRDIRGGRNRVRYLNWLLRNGQPWQLLLQLQAVPRMTNRIDIWVQASHKLAGASWYHCHARSQQINISKGSDQRHYSIRSPGRHKEETNCNCCFRNSHFGWLIGCRLVRSQRIDIHFLCLFP